MMMIYSCRAELVLKMYNYLLDTIFDWSLSGTELYEKIKDGFNGFIDNVDVGFLDKPKKNGICYILGVYAYRGFLENKYFEIDSVLDKKNDESLFFYIEDIFDYLAEYDRHQIDTIKVLGKKIFKLNNLEEEDFLEYIKKIKDYLIAILEKYRSGENNIKKHEREFAVQIAERVFNDRELCFWVSNMLIITHTDGNYKKQFERPSYWPTWLKPALMARERFHCPICQIDFLRPDIIAHIDHMIPINSGGFSDPVNLQLLCESCNTKKKAKKFSIGTDIPKYFRRRL